jgi:hypothetical protein
MGFQEMHVGFAKNLKDFFRPRKLNLVIFLALAAGYNGVFSVLFVITYPMDLLLNNIGYGIGLYGDANNSPEWQAKFDLYRYGISIPATFAFLYLLSCWAAYVMNNVGTPRNIWAITLMIALLLLYVVPYAYSLWANQLAATSK